QREQERQRAHGALADRQQVQRLRLLARRLQADAHAHRPRAFHLDLDAALAVAAEELPHVPPEGLLEARQRRVQARARLAVDALQRRLQLGDRQGGLDGLHLEVLLALGGLGQVGGGAVVHGAEGLELRLHVAQAGAGSALAEVELLDAGREGGEPLLRQRQRRLHGLQPRGHGAGGEVAGGAGLGALTRELLAALAERAKLHAQLGGALVAGAVALARLLVRAPALLGHGARLLGGRGRQARLALGGAGGLEALRGRGQRRLGLGSLSSERGQPARVGGVLALELGALARQLLAAGLEVGDQARVAGPALAGGGQLARRGRAGRA